MKRLVWIVILIFAFGTMAVAAEKATAPMKEESVKIEAAKQTPEKVTPEKTKGAAAKSMNKSDKKSEKALKKGGKDVRELDAKQKASGDPHVDGSVR